MQSLFRVPGTDRDLSFERDDQGRITRISCGPVEYLHAPNPEDVTYGGGFVRSRTVAMPNAMLRSISANGSQWTETYRWDDARVMQEVDGVTFTYDDRHRVTSCRADGGAWFYGYTGEHLTVVDAPDRTRLIVRDDAGRPTRVRESMGAREVTRYDIAYDRGGRRLPRAATPPGWHIDASGRLWTIADADGRIRHTYVWNGFLCFGRIDGAPGEPLAAVFSLDLTGTPVRVVERDRMRRIPRDAFAESLLDEVGVPGLFGGISDGTLLRLPYRRLDPRTGTFDAPDPFSGSIDDPRRAHGYDGPLLAEFANAGPYVVARNNPLSLADPTGAISDLWWLIPSALTWSYQNTVASIFGFWLTMDFTPAVILYLLPNLITLFQNDSLRDENPFGGFFDVEFLGAKNYDAFALRSGGLLAIKDQTWTYQFLVNETGDEFEQLEFARLFQPNLTFTPALYGSILRCVPSSGDPFLLTGQRAVPNSAALTAWSRNGGDANPVIPGSLEPTFPNGALHFSAVMDGRKCPQAATLSELVPQAPVVGSATSNIARGEWPGDARGVATGQSVALISTETDLSKPKPVAVVTVVTVAASGANTVATFDSAAQSLVGQTVRLRGVAAPAGPDAAVQARSARELSLVGTTLNYAVDQVIRADRAGQPSAFATIAKFEARLTLDAALPSTFVGDIHAFRTVAGPEFNAKIQSGTTIQIDSGVVPPGKPALKIGSPGIAVIVTDLTGNVATLDRDISSLGAANTAVKWRLLTRGAELGVRRDAVEAAAQITYEPLAIRSAPTSGELRFETGSEVAARTMAARDFDGLFTGVDLPDPAAAYDVRLLVPQAPDVADVTVSASTSLQLDAATAVAARAFHVMEFGPGGIASSGSPILTGAMISGTDLIATVTAGSAPALAPLQVVVLSTAGTLEVAAIKEVRTTVQFSRPLPGRDNDLEVVELNAGPSYPADRLGDRRARVQPTLNGDRVDMPRFGRDELVLVTWDSGKQERFYRVDAAEGSTFTGVDDDVIDPAFGAPGALTVQRLTVVDPGTGSSRYGRAGHRTAPDAIELAVWNANALGDKDLVAVVGDHPVARRVTFAAAPAPAASRPLNVTLANAPRLAGPVDVSAPQLAGTPASRFVGTFQIKPDNTVLFTDASTAPAAGAAFVAVPYVESGPAAAGTLKPGSVRVPDDHENASLENTRREALTDHELTHTLQSARLGPWLFAWWPNWLSELVGTAASHGDFEGPKFTESVPGVFREHDAELEVARFAEIELKKDAVIQISQEGRVATITLMDNVNAVFSLGRTDLGTLAAAGFTDGPIGVRRQASEFWNKYYSTTQKVFEFLTVGQLMNLMCTASYGGLIWLVMRIAQAVRGTKSDTRYRATVKSPTVVTLDEGVSAGGLDVAAEVAIQAGSSTSVRTITAVEARDVTFGQDIPLTGPVEITVYKSAHALFADHHQYFKGESVDRNRPATIKVEGLALEVHDRVVVRSANGHTKNTKVTSKNQDGSVDIEDPILTDDTPRELLVAKVGHDDPLGWLDQFVLDKMHLGFLQYLHDPYGQIQYRAKPTSTFGQVLTRSARYLLGTKSWGLPLLTGYFWWDNAYRQSEAETSGMEQEASFRSGDTYCPLASLHGPLDVVGDVARYWLTGTGGLRGEAADMVMTGLQDGPGVHWQQYHLLTPSAPANPGYALSDALATKDASGKNFIGIASRGWVPANGELERTSGSYVTFTRPPVAGAQHTVDARNLSGISAGRNAQTKGPSGVISSPLVPVAPAKRRVRISFPKTVQDVTVNVAAVPVNEFVPAAAAVNVIPFQSASVSVTPDGARQYRTTISQPDLAARVDPADGTTLLVGNVPVGRKDFVEVTRFYPAAGAIVTGIGPMHLATDVHVPVRRFDLEVTDQLIVRGTKNPADPAVTELRAGQAVFLFVPAPNFATPAPTIAPAALPVTPVVTALVLDPADPVDVALRTHLGTGGVAYAVAVDRAEPPEEADQTLTFNWRVGASAANSAAVKATITLKPHFTLNRGGGAAGFSVSVNTEFTLEASDGTALALEGADPQITVVPPAATDPASQIKLKVAAPGPRIVIVRETTNDQRLARRQMTVT
jgi:large repetitive protein